MKVADAKWKIETFKQGKRNTADFMIEFDALATKTDGYRRATRYLLTKEEHTTRHYQDDIGIPTHSNARIIQGVESGNYISRTRI